MKRCILFYIFYLCIATAYPAHLSKSLICERVTTLLEQAYQQGFVSLEHLIQINQDGLPDRLASIISVHSTNNALNASVYRKALDQIQSHVRETAEYEILHSIRQLTLSLMSEQGVKSRIYRDTQNTFQVSERKVEPIIVQLSENDGAFLTPPMTLSKPVYLVDAPITLYQWKEVIGDAPPNYSEYYNESETHDTPVHANLWETINFLNRLSEMQGLKPAYQDARLNYELSSRWLKSAFKQNLSSSEKGNPAHYHALINQPNADIYKTEGYRLPTRFEAIMFYEHARRYIDSIYKLPNGEVKESKSLERFAHQDVPDIEEIALYPKTRLRDPIFLGAGAPIFDLIGYGQFYIHDIDFVTNKRALAHFYKPLMKWIFPEENGIYVPDETTRPPRKSAYRLVLNPQSDPGALENLELDNYGLQSYFSIFGLDDITALDKVLIRSSSTEFKITQFPPRIPNRSMRRDRSRLSPIFIRAVRNILK